MSEPKLRKLLDSAFWPETLSAGVTYERVQDDHDGTFEGRIMVQIDRQGDVWFSTDNRHAPPLRFRTWGGGGMSLRTRNALVILAEAIRLDNEEKPQTNPTP